jgi:Fur family ferric uptake transcriptional regulator
MYRRCSPEHHHHIVCIRCGRVWEEQPDAVEHWITDVARRAHARLIDHRAHIFVTCHPCDDQGTGTVPGT